jgi:hypothetical protein
MTDSIRRLLAMMKKESFQILRDPSTLLVAFVLPPVLLFLFGYAVNLHIPVHREQGFQGNVNGDSSAT